MNFYVIRKNHRGVKRNGVGMSWPGFRRHPVKRCPVDQTPQTQEPVSEQKHKEWSNRDRAAYGVRHARFAILTTICCYQYH